MSDGLLPLNPATIPGGQSEDVQDLLGAGGAPAIRQRVQWTGALLIEIARVMNTDPIGSEYAGVVRPIPPRTSNAPAVTQVAGNAANVQLLAANPLRKQACFANALDSSGVLLLKLGAGASASSYTFALQPGGYYELPQPVYTGEIDGIWTTVAPSAGSALVTEIT